MASNYHQLHDRWWHIDNRLMCVLLFLGTVHLSNVGQSDLNIPRYPIVYQEIVENYVQHRQLHALWNGRLFVELIHLNWFQMGTLEVELVATGVPNYCLEPLDETRFVGTTGMRPSKYYMTLWQDFELKKTCSITWKCKQARKRSQGFKGFYTDLKVLK